MRNIKPKMLAVAGIVVSLTTFAAAQGVASPEDTTPEIFGEPFGLALLIGVDKACPHAQSVLQSAAPKDRTLLMTNEAVSAFHHEPCDGICDFAQTNEIVTRCRTEQAIEGCLIYGAAFDGKLHDVSLDPTGSSVTGSCTP